MVFFQELSAAYRDAARRTHPDRGGTKAEFQRLQAAYSSIVAERKAGGKNGKSQRIFGHLWARFLFIQNARSQLTVNYIVSV